MEWYKKILFWEIHRIPLSILVIFLTIFSFDFFVPIYFKDPMERPDTMFGSIFIILILISFNLVYTFSWIITLMLKTDNRKALRKGLIITYLATILISFFSLPLIYFN